MLVIFFLEASRDNLVDVGIESESEEVEGDHDIGIFFGEIGCFLIIGHTSSK
jgi:hypothetical protein